MAYLVGYNPAAPAGERLPPEVRTEIALLVPTTIPAGSVGRDQLQERSVGEDRIDERAVTTTRIGIGAVTETNIAEGAITRQTMSPAAVAAAQVDAGVATTLDIYGDPIALAFIPLTADEYASITPDPNVTYIVRG